MDLQQILKTSRIFYRDHNLQPWRAALPKQARIEHEREVLEHAARHGFTEGFAFPSIALQMSTLDQLIAEMVRKPAHGLPDNQQFTSQPVFSDIWSKEPNGKILQRAYDLGARTDGPYFLLFSLKPVANAWGRTGKQIAELFDAKGWRGLTVPEYLVLQRFYSEKYGDHRFFEDMQEDHPAHWLWLIDSMDETACTVAMSKSQGLNLQGCPVGNRDSRRAAIAAVVVTMVNIP
jgi:hypothetical protein